MKDPLTIAIDYDDTFTADTTAWTKAIELLQTFGHRIVCISARMDTISQRHELECALPANVDVFLSYGSQKREYAKARGLNIDIWIDDMPEAIPSKKDMMLMRE